MKVLLGLLLEVMDRLIDGASALLLGLIRHSLVLLLRVSMGRYIVLGLCLVGDTRESVGLVGCHERPSDHRVLGVVVEALATVQGCSLLHIDRFIGRLRHWGMRGGVLHEHISALGNYLRTASTDPGSHNHTSETRVPLVGLLWDDTALPLVKLVGRRSGLSELWLEVSERLWGCSRGEALLFRHQEGWRVVLPHGIIRELSIRRVSVDQLLIDLVAVA